MLLIPDWRTVRCRAGHRGGPPIVGLGGEDLVAQCEIFDSVATRTGRTPIVVDADQFLVDPERALCALSTVLDIPFSDRMLRWRPGRRDSDGVWAPAWYDIVERSTGFAPAGGMANLPAALQKIADAARPYYDRLARHALISDYGPASRNA